MKTPARISKVTGPPGCGKTTELMRLIRAACDKYIEKKIGAVSFTNAAVENIKAEISRTLEKRGIGENVRTMHSHCFRLLFINEDEVAERHVRDFNEANPEFTMKTSGKNQDEETGQDRDTRTADALFNEMQVLRNRLVPLKKWSPDVVAIHDRWMAFCKKERLTDFTGMLERALADKLVPDIDVLFIDEAQDLTPLQYELTRLWANNVASTVYTGDSDQCIFRFSGAVPEAFIHLQHDWNRHLDQSYRVPPAIHEYAEHIISQAGNRKNTEYKPDKRFTEGRVIHCVEPDLTLDGVHMIICRCNFQVKQWVDYLQYHGHLHFNPYRPSDLIWNPTLTQSWEAVTAYSKILAGLELDVQELYILSKRLKAAGNIKRGGKKKIAELSAKEAVDIFSLVNVGFTNEFLDGKRPLDELFRITGAVAPFIHQEYELNGFKMFHKVKPRVIVGTIHSVKGGQADHVWVDSGITPTIYREMISNPAIQYDEARVAYVAATRAKKTLGILAAKNPNPLLPRI